MKIYLASDHAGFYLKEKVKQDLESRGFLIEDFGAHSFESIDNYPEIIAPCIKRYKQETRGNFASGFCIVFGGSGTGEAIVSNRFKGIRAVVLNSENLELVKLGREHNNANVLSVGARFVSEKTCLEAVKVFQTTPFQNGRHAKRILELDMLE
jgi:ribose 5-phosphate isomerase B